MLWLIIFYVWMIGVVITIVALEAYAIFNWKAINIICLWYLLLAIIVFIVISKKIFSTLKMADYSNHLTT
jgi:hypothetical protein